MGGVHLGTVQECENCKLLCNNMPTRATLNNLKLQRPAQSVATKHQLYFQMKWCFKSDLLFLVGS